MLVYMTRDITDSDTESEGRSRSGSTRRSSEAIVASEPGDQERGVGADSEMGSPFPRSKNSNMEITQTPEAVGPTKRRKKRTLGRLVRRHTVGTAGDTDGGGPMQLTAPELDERDNDMLEVAEIDVTSPGEGGEPIGQSVSLKRRRRRKQRRRTRGDAHPPAAGHFSESSSGEESEPEDHREVRAAYDAQAGGTLEGTAILAAPGQAMAEEGVFGASGWQDNREGQGGQDPSDDLYALIDAQLLRAPDDRRAYRTDHRSDIMRDSGHRYPNWNARDAGTLLRAWNGRPDDYNELTAAVGRLQVPLSNSALAKCFIPANWKEYLKDKTCPTRLWNWWEG